MNQKRVATIVWAAAVALSAAVVPIQAQPTLTPGVDYSKPNFAYSPPLRKFVDSLPGLTAGGINNLGQYIPIATPDTTAYPGSDYYEIALVQYREQMHSDLPPVVGASKTDPAATGGTLLRGYVQEVHGVPVDQPHYLGPLIIAQKDRAVRIKFTNRLPTGAAGDLFLPVDTTIMGAGAGPVTDAAGNPLPYTQNRATLHLHGGFPPWISDGTAHQWTAPAGELTPYLKGASARSVPDMDLPGDGSLTFYWPNQQSGRLMFYHDHAYGITGPNVYAGEAAGYLLVDPVERGLTAGMPEVPLVIQDKTFVPDAATLAATDPLWDSTKWGGFGNLWYPHVYMPNQDPTSDLGANPVGRWDYGPWFWPPWPVEPGSTPPLVSHVPESFLDTPVVNGTAYPYIEVQPTEYRLRILNACNDRMFNLQWEVADPAVTRIDVTAGGTGYSPATTVQFTGGGSGASATPVIVGGVIQSVDVISGGSNYFTAPAVAFVDPAGTGSGANALAAIATEPKMIPSIPGPTIPPWYPQMDLRDGGVPDPMSVGPAWIQIGTEGGILPKPVVLKNTPVGYEYDRRNIVVLNVKEKTLFLAAAERADVVVDFSAYAGRTLILYNDSPAPVPATDPRYDFYTDNPDFTGSGGAPSTPAGWGPNTRTIMQFRVRGTPSATAPPTNAFNAVTLARLNTALPGAFRATQPVPVVPQAAYNGMGYNFAGVSNGFATNNYVRIQYSNITFTPYDSTVSQTVGLLPKAIQELFDPLGRMNATLGVELPFTTALIQTTIPLGFIDPATEVFRGGETQIWKLTHNGVDTHGVHFHLVNVQILNRVGWDGAIRPPDANEMGWKDTVRMHPLEDVIVAVRAEPPAVPFECPDSVRPLDVTMPLGSRTGFTGVDPTNGNPVTVINTMVNFGWEYTWHCHLLGHEENDMMRPIILNVLPGRPTGLVATAINANQVNLTWTDNCASETGFRIERAPGLGASGTFVALGTVGANAIAYADTMVQPTTTYTYRVIAFNPTLGDSVPSDPATVTTPDVAPAAPTALVASIAGPPLQVNLIWVDNATNETGYLVQRAVVVGGLPGPFTPLLSAGANATSYSDTTALPGTTYAYQVMAFNGAGNSAPATAVISTPSLPLAPTLLAPTQSGPPIQVNLAWADNSVDELGFRLERADVAAGVLGPYAPIASLPANAVAAIDAAVVQGATYSYRVVAFNMAGDAASNEQTVTILSVPAAPTALAGVPVGPPLRLDLSWVDNSANESSFVLQRADVVGGVVGAFVTLITTGPNVMSYSDLTVQPGASYSYQVIAANAAGSSAPATLTLTLPSLAAPPSLQVPTQSGPPVQVNLAWLDNSADELGFRVERALVTSGAVGPYVALATLAPNTVTAADAAVTPGATYSYRVVAFNIVGDSASNPQTVTVTTVPVAPSGLAVILVGPPLRVDLSWTDNSVNEAAFVVQRAIVVNGVPGTYTTLTTTGPNVTAYSDSSVQPATVYSYQVTASNVAGTSGPASLTVTTPALAPAPTLRPPTQSGPPIQVNLAWLDNSTDELGFRVERAPVIGGTVGAYVVLSNGAPNITAAVDALVTQGATYSYRVVAFNMAGDSSSAPQAVTVLTIPAAPSAFGAVAAGPPLQVNLSWVDVAGNEAGYRLERAVGAGAYATIATLAANTVSAVDGAVLPATVYRYRLMAFNAAGSSTPVLAQLTTPNVPPNAPGNVRATASTPGVAPVTLTVRWNDNTANEATFSVERAPVTGGTVGTYAVVGSVSANITVYVDATVTPSASYRYRVRAVNPAGYGPYGTMPNAVTASPSSVPAAPSNLQVINVANNALTLGWNNNANNATGFELRRATSASGPWTTVATLGANATQRRDAGLNRRTTYYYQVRAVNDFGASAWVPSPTPVAGTTN